SQLHIQIVSRLIEGDYPDYKAVIPGEYRTKTITEKGELLNHLKASSVFAGKMNEVRFLFDPSKKGVEMIAQSAEVGENTSFLEADVSGEKSEVSFNWRFVADGLSQIKGQQIEVGVSSESGPTSIKPTTEEGYLYVVMPVRA
ncbi:MAG: DNA polymerase III subunit beta, partial [archaeon]|nr:DNA polymerase III subunit beta [archaeon]